MNEVKSILDKYIEKRKLMFNIFSFIQESSGYGFLFVCSIGDKSEDIQLLSVMRMLLNSSDLYLADSKEINKYLLGTASTLKQDAQIMLSSAQKDIPLASGKKKYSVNN